MFYINASIISNAETKKWHFLFQMLFPFYYTADNAGSLLSIQTMRELIRKFQVYKK